jgi:hypothetical protein
MTYKRIMVLFYMLYLWVDYIQGFSMTVTVLTLLIMGQQLTIVSSQDLDLHAT